MTSRRPRGLIENWTPKSKTTKAEAIPRSRLREIVAEAVEVRVALDTYQDILAEELEIRERLSSRLSTIREG